MGLRALLLIDSGWSESKGSGRLAPYSTSVAG